MIRWDKGDLLLGAFHHDVVLGAFLGAFHHEITTIDNYDEWGNFTTISCCGWALFGKRDAKGQGQDYGVI